MKIVYLDCPKVSVTGGHKYNDAFMAYLSSYSGLDYTTTPGCSDTYKWWNKILAPFIELKHLPKLQKGDLVFWGDTSFRYHFILAIFARLFKRLNSFIIIHHYSQYPHNIKGHFIQVFQQWYIKQCGIIIVPSPYTLDRTKQIFPKKKVLYIPLPFEKKYECSNDYQTGNLLYVGTTEKRKGLLYLIEALAIYHRQKPEQKISLDIVGKVVDEDYAAILHRQIEEYNLTNMVHFRGRVSIVELEQLYRRAEIFTFPSLLEGYGIVLVEALNRGVPIIAFNNSAMPYTVKEGINGFLAENKSALSFSQKLLLLGGNRSLRAQLQEGIKNSVDALKTKKEFEDGIVDLFNNCKKK